MFFFLLFLFLTKKKLNPFFKCLLDIGKYKLILGKASKDGFSGHGR